MGEIRTEEAAEGVVVVTLDRPPVNALETAFGRDLTATLEREGERSDAIVLTGAGRAFSAGVDTKAAATLDRAGQRAGVEAINRLVTTLFALPVPVVAAVNGHALGGGLVIPLACDVVVATSADCKLGLTEVVAGVPFPAAPLEAVRHRLAPPVYNNLCLTGRVVGPEEALALGVVDELAAPGRLVERAVEIAAQLARYPAYARVKDQVRATARAEMERAVERDPLLTGWLAG
ncbi:MAG: enoyl-CoA hydratase/isomerase family protein [Solirubrobacterales bacterium]